MDTKYGFMLRCSPPHAPGPQEPRLVCRATYVTVTEDSTSNDPHLEVLEVQGCLPWLRWEGLVMGTAK